MPWLKKTGITVQCLPLCADYYLHGLHSRETLVMNNNQENMKQTRITLILLALLALLAVVSCRSAKESAPANPISYTVAQNYFVRNDVQHFGEMQISTQEQFDSTFGIAAYMGRGGQPTPIDFSRQMVLAVTCEPVNRHVSLEAVSLSASADGTLTLVYRKKVGGGPLSYTSTPCLVVVADKVPHTAVRFKQVD